MYTIMYTASIARKVTVSVPCGKMHQNYRATPLCKHDCIRRSWPKGIPSENRSPPLPCVRCDGSLPGMEASFSFKIDFQTSVFKTSKRTAGKAGEH